MQDPTDRTVQFVVQQAGRIRVVRSGAVLGDDFLNLTDAASRAAANAACSASRSRPTTRRAGASTSTSRTRPATPSSRDSRAPRIRSSPILRHDSICSWTARGDRRHSPFSNHNGGHLAFGPDGYLYIGLGDGGSGNDPDHRAQNPNELLGKMLRIDVNVPDADPFGYRIPPDNPFVGPAAPRDEIWAFGLRNPWRYSFDDVARGGTGALVIGDVGQNSLRGNRLRAARRRRPQLRLAQSRRHARQRHDATARRFYPSTDPIFDYGRSDGVSVTGGFVYRGSAARRRLSRTIFLRRLLGPRLVARAHDRRRRRSPRVGSPRAHSRARRQHGARVHQLVRRRRRRRALHRQSFQRQDRSHHRAARRAIHADGTEDHQSVTGAMGAMGAMGARVQWVRGVRRVQQVRRVQRVRGVRGCARKGCARSRAFEARLRFAVAGVRAGPFRQGRGERAVVTDPALQVAPG